MANKDTKCPHCNTFPVGDNVCVDCGTTACERCAKTNFVEDTEETIESGKL